MSWYKKAEIVQRLFDLGSNPDSISIYLCGIFKEKKVLLANCRLSSFRLSFAKSDLNLFLN